VNLYDMKFDCFIVLFTCSESE